MDALTLKKFIFENKKIEEVLGTIGCHHIEYHEKDGGRSYYSACQPDGDNPNGVNIFDNAYLDYRSFSRGISLDDKEDLISLVQSVKNMDFRHALLFLCKMVGLSTTDRYVPKKKSININQLFVECESCATVDVRDISEIREEALNDYEPLLWYGWFKEGITGKTRKKFDIEYSYLRKRIVIPIRDWATGNICGFNMRTTVKDYDLLGVSKYWITPGYMKQSNLYGLAQNYDFIVKNKLVTVFEAEKSVLKRDSRNDSSGVALQGHSISPEQVRILIGLNAEIVIAMDKDVSINMVRMLCEKFYHIRPVSYIYDKYDLLGVKDSPADSSNKIYNYLFKHRVKYDEAEHQQFLESLKR